MGRIWTFGVAAGATALLGVAPIFVPALRPPGVAAFCALLLTLGIATPLLLTVFRRSVSARPGGVLWVWVLRYGGGLSFILVSYAAELTGSASTILAVCGGCLVGQFLSEAVARMLLGLAPSDMLPRLS